MHCSNVTHCQGGIVIMMSVILWAKDMHGLIFPGPTWSDEYWPRLLRPVISYSPARPGPAQPGQGPPASPAKDPWEEPCSEPDCEWQLAVSSTTGSQTEDDNTTQWRHYDNGPILSGRLSWTGDILAGTRPVCLNRVIPCPCRTALEDIYSELW